MQEEESVECRKVRVLAERASLPSFPWSSTSLFSKEVALYLYVCVYIHVNIPEHTTKVIGSTTNYRTHEIGVHTKLVLYPLGLLSNLT